MWDFKEPQGSVATHSASQPHAASSPSAATLGWPCMVICALPGSLELVLFIAPVEETSHVDERAFVASDIPPSQSPIILSPFLITFTFGRPTTFLKKCSDC